MPVQVETLALISAIQGAVLAGMIWAGVRGTRSAARRSLSLRAAALAVEAMGWSVLAGASWFTPAQLLLGGNAFNLAAQAMAVIAVCMLLDEPLRLRLVIGIAVVGWLGVVWLSVVQPDYRWRVLWGTGVIFCNIGLQAQALLHGRSRARTVMLLVLALAASLLLWRNAVLWLGAGVSVGVTQQSTVNSLYVLFAGMQPLFASIAFLLLYGDVLERQLHRLARVDALTGVNNRLALNEAARRLLAGAARSGQPLGVLMLDADHFKRVNDRFGHGGGDQVLRVLVSSIAGTLRATDVIGRVGGEEFVVLAPDTPMHALLALAERIRATLAATPLTLNGVVLHLTVSIGAAVAPPGASDVAATLKLADNALYAAKRAGRDRVAAWPQETTAEADIAVDSAPDFHAL